MFSVYLDVIDFGYDGKVCSTLEDGLKPLGEFKTLEEAKKFFDDYNFDWDYNEAVKEQGYGFVTVILTVEDEDGEEVYEKTKTSEPRDNAICVWEIRDDSDFGNVLETFSDEQEAVKAFDNWKGSISLYEVWKYPDIDDEETLYDYKEAEDGQEE